MAGIDLTGARRRVSERVFVDRVSFLRNPTTVAPVIDDTTGDPAVDPDADASTLATDVPAVIREVNRVENVNGVAVVEKVYEVTSDYFLTPDDLKIGDTIVVTTSADPELQGRTLFVSRVVMGTLRVARKCEASRRQDDASKH